MLAAVRRAMSRRGLELVASPSRSEPHLVRVRLAEQGSWVSLAIEDLETPDAWARTLARALRVPVLGAWFWDGEARLSLTLFEGDAAPAVLALPDHARRAADGRVAIALGDLSRLVATASPKETGLEVLVRSEEASFDEDGRCVYLPEEDAESAVSRAFRIGALFLDPLEEDAVDDGAGDQLLHFRPKPTSAIAKRARAEREAEVRARRADHDGRLYTIGWLAFAAAPEDVASLLARAASPIVETLTPHLGPRVLSAHGVVPGKSEKLLPAPGDGARAWKRYAEALREGVLVALGQNDAPVLASVWIVFREGALVVGWCLRGLKDPSKRAEIAARMDGVLSSSTDDPRCFGALLTCQQSAMSLARQVLAYEYLRSTSVAALRADTHRARARAPGWRVLVPRAAAPLEGEPPPGVGVRITSAGIVLEAGGESPHAMTPDEMDALERYLASSGALAS